MVQTKSNIPTTSHIPGEGNSPGNSNGTRAITSTPDAVQGLFGMGVTVEHLHATIAALSAIGGSGRGIGATQALEDPITEHAATSQHKGKKTRRSQRRLGKSLVIKEVLVEDIPEGGMMTPARVEC
ncbi:unnamed protein product [Cuscuta campestris]|uniref:Uncharacterized protein n=1 Tax=Cuscuta campestris TaxID=132261 RepID=A0A484L705_9ASTE|nr:unnamed protein product [Cuscuta campestris]